MIKVIKNFLSPEKADIIEKDLLSWNFDWYYYNTTVGEDAIPFKTKNTIDTPQFIHLLMMNHNNDIRKSTVFEGFKNIFDNINYDILSRAKCNLNLNVTGYKKSSHQPIHRDEETKDFKSLIYYINDSDGDTIFFNNKLKEIKRVKPEKNTAVLFDANILHCGCNPIKSGKRALINFLFKGNEKSILYR